MAAHRYNEPMKYWIKIWDLPIRLFHWSLAISFIVSVLSIEVYDNIEVHFISGLIIFALIIFRIIWGFLGTSTAKFSSFYPSLSSAYRYIKTKNKTDTIGHSPIAAFAVYALLLALFVQSFSGMFSDDDIYFTGPLNRFANTDMVSTMSVVHFYTSKLLFILVALHLIAIAWYFFKKKENLIKPMITGGKEVDDDSASLLTQSINRASAKLFIVSVLIAGTVAGYLYYLNS